MRTKYMKVGTIALMLSFSSFYADAANIVNEQNKKAVGHVVWNKQSAINPIELINKAIPKGDVSLFFIRALDNDAEQTSANIAINDTFQVSLQPGSYTQVYSCSGINRISAEITGNKTNDLLLNMSSFNLEPNHHYFFYVDVDENGQSTVQRITQESALEHLNSKLYQAHQTSRVRYDCPAPQVKPEVKPPTLILEEKVVMDLEVMFDNDKDIIKPDYYSRVKGVADFMMKYGNTEAIIEGHTDSNASVAYNQDLSERRANAVKNMLVNRFGIESHRLSTIGYGELQPRATNETADGRQLNRRVMAVIEERE